MSAASAVVLALALAANGVTGATLPTPARVLNRCTGPDGAVAVQDAPCPPGHRQETREVATMARPPLPPPAAHDPPPSTTVDVAPAPMALDTDADAPRIEAGTAAPPPRSVLPPPLWRCTDLNNATRLVDHWDPQPRCVPLSVLGVDLSRAPPAAATLCQTVTDDCVELRGEAACAAWEERLAAAEAALRTAFSDTQAARRADYERAKAVVEDDCAR